MFQGIIASKSKSESTVELHRVFRRTPAQLGLARFDPIRPGSGSTLVPRRTSDPKVDRVFRHFAYIRVTKKRPDIPAKLGKYEIRERLGSGGVTGAVPARRAAGLCHRFRVKADSRINPHSSRI